MSVATTDLHAGDAEHLREVYYASHPRARMERTGDRDPPGKEGHDG